MTGVYFESALITGLSLGYVTETMSHSRKRAVVRERPVMMDWNGIYCQSTHEARNKVPDSLFTVDRSTLGKVSRVGQKQSLDPRGNKGVNREEVETA